MKTKKIALNRPGQRWSMDFMSDELENGRRFKILNIVDDYTRKYLGTVTDYSITGESVTKKLDQMSRTDGLPVSIQTDNGPEFTEKQLDTWGFIKGVNLEFIRPGKPMENGYIECLNANVFRTIDEARVVIESFRREYNSERPHSSLGYLTPNEFHKKSKMNLVHLEGGRSEYRCKQAAKLG